MCVRLSVCLYLNFCIWISVLMYLCIRVCATVCFCLNVCVFLRCMCASINACVCAFLCMKKVIGAQRTYFISMRTFNQKFVAISFFKLSMFLSETFLLKKKDKKHQILLSSKSIMKKLFSVCTYRPKKWTLLHEINVNLRRHLSETFFFH